MAPYISRTKQIPEIPKKRKNITETLLKVIVAIAILGALTVVLGPFLEAEKNVPTANQTSEEQELVSRQSGMGRCNDLKVQDRKECRLKIDPCYYETDSKEECMSLATQDYRYCEGDSECIFNYIKTNPDQKACGEIDDAGLSHACESIVGTQDYCKEIKQQEDRNKCYKIYATTVKTDELCGKISKGSTYSLDCYLFFALETNDSDQCRNVQIENDRRWTCYANYSLSTGDISGCDAIERYASVPRNECYTSIAERESNVSLCEIIENELSRNLCIQRVNEKRGAIR